MNGLSRVLVVLACVAACGGEPPAEETPYYASYASRGVEARGTAKRWADQLQNDWRAAQKRTPGLPDMDSSVLKFVVERMTVDAIGEWTTTDKARGLELKRRSDLFRRDPSLARMFDCLGYMGDNLTSDWLNTHEHIALESAILQIKAR